MRINNSTPWRDKLLRALNMSYGRAPYFRDVFPLLADLVNNPIDSLAEYNLSAIRSLTRALQLDTSELVLGSTLAVEEQATDLLIAMVKAVGGTAYLSGGGAGGYQEDDKFAAAALELIYQDFHHPVYPQCTNEEFIPGLSVIDALMNCSFEQTRALVSATQVQR
jgi:hypothetical protein